MAGFVQCNGGKLEESEGYDCFFNRLMCVRIEIDQALVRELLSNNSCLSVSCKQINHSRFALMILSPLQLTSKQ